MANIYLDATNPADAALTVTGNGSKVFGTSANEVVSIAAGVTGVTLDGNIDGEKLSGAVSAYTYKQLGNVLAVYDKATGALVSSIAVSSAGDKLTFADGTVQVNVTAPVIDATTGTVTKPSTITLGGATVTATNATDTATNVTAPAAVVPTTIDKTNVTSTPVSTGATVGVKLTTGLDNLTATGTNNTFVASLVDNANTLQSGDTLAGTGTDKLVATIANSQKFAILANTTGITTVQIQAEGNSLDSTNNNTSQTNQVQIDAQNMQTTVANPMRFEDNNSRSDLLIEDIRLPSSNVAGSNADHSEVILNADRTVNDVATKAAGTTAWEVTKDVTIAMVSTDPGHVDYGVYFDDNSLRAGSSVTNKFSTLNLQLMDVKGAELTGAANAPLKQNPYAGVTILVDGKAVTIPLVNAAGAPITTTYTDLLTAINAGIASVNATQNNILAGVTAALTTPFTKIDSNNGLIGTGGQTVTLTSTNSILGGGQAGDASTWVLANNSGAGGNSNVVATMTPTAVVSTISPLVTSTIILDDVGRGAMGGNFVDGSLSTGDTSNSQGVSQFNITVDRSSQLESINSTNNALKEVYITSGNNISNASGIHNGNLTVTGQVASGNNASTNMSGSVTALPFAAAAGTAASVGVVAPISTAGTANVSGTSVATTNGVASLTSGTGALPNSSSNTSGVGQPLPGVVTTNGGSQFNQYGFNDVRVIDASSAATSNAMAGATAFAGNLTYSAAITNAAIAKYLTLTDSAPAVANADNVPFIYTGSAQADKITVALDPQAMATQTNNLGGREDLTLSVDGGAGNDNITVGVYTSRDADGNYAAAGNTQAWYTNQKLNANITVSGGAGDDTIFTPGAGDKKIFGGTGADTIYSDNTGREVVSDPNNSMVTLSQASSTATYSKGEALATATWVVNAANPDATNPLNLNDLKSWPVNDIYALYQGKLAVTFDGYTSSKIVIPTTTPTSYVTSDLQINQAIKTAINSDPVLSKLLLAQDGPAATLVITSKIDGVYGAGDIAINITKPTAADITNSGVSLLDIYNAQHGVTTVSKAAAAANTAITATSIAAEQGSAIVQDNAGTGITAFFGNATASATSSSLSSVSLANDGTLNADGTYHLITGANSVTTSDNVIAPGTSDAGIDVTVLGTTYGATTLASSNETVSLTPGFGKDVIVHFDSNAGDAGQDTLDFSQLFTNVGTYSATAVSPTSVSQTFDVKVQTLVSTATAPAVSNLGTTANDTSAAVKALYGSTGSLGSADWTNATTVKTQPNGIHYDHVLVVKNPTTGFAEVYTVDNGNVTDQGSIALLGLGGQTTGGAVLDLAAVSFGAVTNNTATAAVTANGGYGAAAAVVVPGLPTVSLASNATAAGVNEGSAVTYTATLSSAAPAGGLNIPYTLSGTGITTGDFTGVAALTGTINVAAGSTTGTLTLNVAADNLTEGNETLNVALGTTAGVTLGAVTSTNVVINDTSTTPAPGSAISVTVTGANATPNDATLGNVTYSITPLSTYTYNINGFNTGDKLLFALGSAEAVTNTSGTDGILDVAGTLNGNQVTIHLTGVPAALDGQVFNPASFNTAFGAGSLV